MALQDLLLQLGSKAIPAVKDLLVNTGKKQATAKTAPVPSSSGLSDEKRTKADEILKSKGLSIEKKSKAEEILKARGLALPNAKPVVEAMPQPKPLIEVMNENKQQNNNDFLGNLGKNILNAPGQMVGAMSDVLTGKGAEKIKAAEKKYGEDLSSGKEKPILGTEGGAEGIASKILGEGARFGSSAIGGLLEGGGNLINTAYDVATPFSDEGGMKPGNFLTGAGQSMKGLGSLISGVPQDSISGELGNFIGELESIKSPSGLASELIGGANKSKLAIGSLLRGEKILEGSSAAKKGGEGVNTVEKVLNKVPKLLENITKGTAKNAVDTALFTGASEGKLPTKEELAAGVLIGNVMDAFGGILKDAGKTGYQKAIKLFSGKEESVATLARKTAEAIEEGFTGGKDPMKYAELADNKIASYSQAVQNEMKAKNVSFGQDFLKGINQQIEKIQKVLPEKAKYMKSELNRFLGTSYEKDLNTVVKKIDNTTKNLAGYEESLALAKKKGNVAGINKIEASIRNERMALEKLTEKQAYLTDLIPKVKKDSFDLFDFQRIRQIAADKNPSIVSGVTAPSARDQAANELWLLMRDESENYLNKVLPELKDVNSRLNVAYRIKDAMTPYLKNAEAAMKKGTNLAGFMYNRGNDLQQLLSKTAVRKTLTDGTKAVQKTIGQGLEGLSGLIAPKTEAKK